MKRFRLGEGLKGAVFFLGALFFAIFVAVGTSFGDDSTAQNGACGVDKKYTKPTADELKKLSPLQYEVTQKQSTEAPFHNEYWNNHQAGIYVDVVSGEPLFSSLDKFDSGTGWPSFTKPLEAGNVSVEEDTALGMTRTEVHSKHGGSHLGHLFDDGPAPTGQRYCMNSASLRFIPVAKLVAEGYGQYLSLFQPAASSKPTPAAVSGPSSAPIATSSPGATSSLGGTASPVASSGSVAAAKPNEEQAILAGGCFWGMQEIIRKIPGVIRSRVGYSGGDVSSPTYTLVSTGETGHAESVEVTFDPAKLSYEQLLHYFFRMHDPTTLNRQENDVGTQYRSAIFYLNDQQKETAEKVKDEVGRSGKWKGPIVTQIVHATEFYPAEQYHQDYLEKHPDGYTCHFLRPE